MELITGDGILMRGKNLLVLFVIVIIFSFFSCEINRKRENIIDILEHDYSKIDNYEDLYKEFEKQKFSPCSADYYAYDINNNESFWVEYNLDKKIFYVSLLVGNNISDSAFVIQEYLNILDEKYGKRYYENFQIKPYRFSDGEVSVNEYTRQLPCWKSDELEIFFYMYDKDPVWGNYFDKYSTFIVKRFNP